MSTTVTVRPARGALRIAVLGPTVDHPFHTNVTFVRGWRVFVDGEFDADLWVGQTESGALCGLLGAEILIEDAHVAASNLAFRLWRRAVERRQARAS